VLRGNARARRAGRGRAAAAVHDDCQGFDPPSGECGRPILEPRSRDDDHDDAETIPNPAHVE